MEMFMLIALPLLVFIIYKSNSSDKKDKILNELYQKYKYYFLGDNQLIAITKDCKHIVLDSGAGESIYEISQIRGHEFSNSQGATVFSGGAAAALGHGLAQMAIARYSGYLTIEMKDIDNPRWYIKMYNKEDQHRWHEILQQLYEGTLS